MRVLQINIRASQGGAGRVCLDLHRRLRALGHDSRLLYGYASGIAEDPAVADEAGIEMLGSKPAVLANFAAHRLIGEDLFTGSKARLRERVAWADIVHLHAPHHYFMAWSDFIAAIERFNKPVLATAHDWWFITGRCGFVEDCTAWREGCGQCGPRRHRDLPSLLDRSAVLRQRKLATIRARGSRFAFACPSHHLADDYRDVFGETAVTHVPNAVDAEFEAAVTGLDDMPREHYLFSASDLSSPGKIDRAFVNGLLPELHRQIRFVGRNSPFTEYPDSHLGEVRGRVEMARILNRSKALVFTSQMDNAPLTILEALSAGAYVVALPSPAAEEMVARVGGRCLRDRAEGAAILRSGDVAALYGGIDPSELSRRARAEFSGNRLAERYIDLYKGLVTDEVSQ